MIINPRIRGFVCTTAHPAGCKANVLEQIRYVEDKGPVDNGPKNVLVIGASMGYGLASRIVTAFGCGAATTGVFMARGPAAKRPAAAGWYNSAAFGEAAKKRGLRAININGDAFSDDVKSRVVDGITRAQRPVDMVIYSVASPVRLHPKTGETHRSVLKPLHGIFRGKTLDTDRVEVMDIEVGTATESETFETVSVMGGEDWELWIDALDGAGCLAEGCRSLAYTYIGPTLTWPIYQEGTIGEAKKDLDRAARAIDARLARIGGYARIAAMKAMVTQACSAIPVVPLYLSVLFRIMKDRNIHEGCIEQVWRLFAEKLYGNAEPPVDELGKIRMDDREMREDVQSAVEKLWPGITTANLNEKTDFEGYRTEFLKLFGFGLEGVEYAADVDPVVSLEE